MSPNSVSMKYLRAFLFVWVSGCCQFADAQTLPRSVISSSGDQFFSAAGSLEWTLGEIMTETYSQEDGFLTQGFQQPYRIIVTSLSDQESGILIYPNPVFDFVYVKTDPDHEWQVELFDLHGKRLVTPIEREDSRTQVDLRGLGNAIYLLGISNTTTGTKTYHKVIKK
jgi:hypothetical protein